jgi:hypothetical protein
MDYLKVKDHPDLVRDTKSNAILNTDLDALNKYREDRNYKMKLARVVEDNETMKQEMSEIKNLLKQLLEQR